MKSLILLYLLCFTLFAQMLFGQSSTPTESSNPRDQLQQLTSQLQKSPDDAGLRSKIISLALTLAPKPTAPDAAVMAEGAAEYAFRNAKSNSDYSDAAKQYEKALLLAPWVAADYFNGGVAHEKAGENGEAIRDFGIYLLAAPNADDAEMVKKRIGGLQYAEQKRVSDEMAKTAADLAKVQEEAAAARARVVAEEQATRDFLRNINGDWYNVAQHLHIDTSVPGRISVSIEYLIQHQNFPDPPYDIHVTADTLSFKARETNSRPGHSDIIDRFELKFQRYQNGRETLAGGDGMFARR